MLAIRLLSSSASVTSCTRHNCILHSERKSGSHLARPQPLQKLHVKKNHSATIYAAQDGANSRGVTWSKSASPYEILGLSGDCTAEEIRTAFREKVKIYHPDVYRGEGDSQGMMMRLIQAYEILAGSSSSNQFFRKSTSDPFSEPEGDADTIFVNELRCRGPSCSESCVRKCPQTFHFGADTQCARAIGAVEDEYSVFLAVGQCPESCIHFVTNDQRGVLEEQLRRGINREESPQSTAFVLESLLARAKYENGRSRAPTRKPKSSEEWVDWF